jgi:hypothetical protein
LAQVLAGLDFSGPIKRAGQVGSGDTLARTIRTVAASLSGMTSAKHAAVNPLRGPGVARDAGRALFRSMDALEKAAKDAPMHRSVGELMGMTD